MSVRDKCSDIYFKYFSFMVLKKWHTLEISNLTKDLHARSVALPEDALRGDANWLRVQGGCPLPLAQGWEGTWGGRRAMASLSPVAQSHEIVVEVLAWTLLSGLCAWEDHLFDLHVSCLEATAISNKKTVPFSLRAVCPLITPGCLATCGDILVVTSPGGNE